MVVGTFPSFRDEAVYEGQKRAYRCIVLLRKTLTSPAVCFWKRAQILVAEAWAAFYPSDAAPHPLFPNDAAISGLTMFADYRVPQILNHLQILNYPRALVKKLLSHEPLTAGCKEEISIRAASIVAVERVRQEIVRLNSSKQGKGDADEVSSVLIDFYLWDLAKRIEVG